MNTVIIILLVAGICFALGQAFERTRCDALEQQRLEDEQDRAVFEDSLYGETILAEAFRPIDERPRLHVVHDDTVDERFDELCRLGLVEQS